MRDRTQDQAENDRLSIRIREELARRRMSRQALADQARISLSTLEKALSGQRSFTLATLISIENALGIPLRAAAAGPTPAGQMACTALGSYSRSAAGWLEGTYLTIRPGFNDPITVYAYLTRIHWDDSLSALVFEETGRSDSRFAQAGQVSMPYLSAQIHLVTNTDGQYRLATLGRSSSDGMLHGILSTLYVGDGARLVPIACPLMLRGLEEGEKPDLGLFHPGDAIYDQYRTLIDKTVSRGFARLHP